MNTGRTWLFLAVIVAAPLKSFASPMVPEFSWREYVSPGRDQIVQGPCHAFAEVGLIEAMARLYYNRPDYSLTLAPKHAYSILSLELGQERSVPSNDPYSSWPAATLAFAREIGLVSEALYPWRPEPNSVTFYFGQNPDRQRLADNIKVTIPEYQQITLSSADDIKRKLLQYGPIKLSMRHWDLYNGNAHGLLLIGWRTGSAGETEWEFMDSWPALILGYDGTQTYDPYYRGRLHFAAIDILAGNPKAHVVLPVSGGRAISVRGLSARNCHDHDGDRYAYWGIGPKPSTCPAGSHAELDGDDNDPSLGPRNADGYPVAIVPPQELTVSSQGAPVSRSMTVHQTATFYWRHTDYYSIPTSGYYMRVMLNGKTVGYSSHNNQTRSGSFKAYKGQAITVEVRGGTITANGFTRGFYGKGVVNN